MLSTKCDLLSARLLTSSFIWIARYRDGKDLGCGKRRSQPLVSIDLSFINWMGGFYLPVSALSAAEKNAVLTKYGRLIKLLPHAGMLYSNIHGHWLDEFFQML